MESKDIDFIARHYRRHRFNTESGWRRFGLASSSPWKRFRVAAAIAVLVVISATAAIIYHEYHTVEVQHTTGTPSASPLAEIRVIDFENAPLAEVVKRIETVYNVKVENLPDNSKTYNLSLHYEGTPTDLIAVINDILGTQMTVVEK